MKKEKLIDFTDMLSIMQGDKKFIQEFTDAATISFSEFSEHYSKYLLERNETDFRKAGHKIKPVAQMLNINVILKEYERQKSQFYAEKTKAELQESAEKMTKICDQVLAELKEFKAES